MQTIQTAISSYGMSGMVFHGPLLETNPGFNIAKILERHHSNSKVRHPKAKIVRSYSEILLDGNIELVVVNTPDYLHYKMAKEALNAGKHTIVEKPLTLKSREANELIELAAKKNLMLTVFQNRRWDGDFLTVKNVIREELLGRLVSYESHFDRFRNYIQDSWKEDKSVGAGTLYNLGSHLVDQALHLFGMPVYLFADVRAQRTNSKVDDSFDIFMHYPETKCIVRGSYLVLEEGPRYILHGTQGSFLKSGIDPQEEALKSGMSPNAANWGSDLPALFGILKLVINGKETKKQLPTIPGNYNAFYNNIYAHLRKGEELSVKPEEARDVILIIEAAYKSAKTGEVVRFK